MIFPSTRRCVGSEEKEGKCCEGGNGEALKLKEGGRVVGKSMLIKRERRCQAAAFHPLAEQRGESERPAATAAAKPGLLPRGRFVACRLR